MYFVRLCTCCEYNTYIHILCYHIMSEIHPECTHLFMHSRELHAESLKARTSTLLSHFAFTQWFVQFIFVGSLSLGSKKGRIEKTSDKLGEELNFKLEMAKVGDLA